MVTEVAIIVLVDNLKIFLIIFYQWINQYLRPWFIFHLRHPYDCSMLVLYWGTHHGLCLVSGHVVNFRIEPEIIKGILCCVTKLTWIFHGLSSYNNQTFHTFHCLQNVLPCLRLVGGNICLNKNIWMRENICKCWWYIIVICSVSTNLQDWNVPMSDFWLVRIWDIWDSDWSRHFTRHPWPIWKLTLSGVNIRVN